MTKREFMSEIAAVNIEESFVEKVFNPKLLVFVIERIFEFESIIFKNCFYV